MRKLIAFAVVAALLAAPAFAYFVKDQLLVGEARNYTTGAGYHEVVLVTVSELSKEAVFSVNGQYSDSLKEEEDFFFPDGTHIKVDDILYGKRSYVSFYLSPGKGRPVPSNVGPAGSAGADPEDACDADTDCLDDDPCTQDACAGEPKLCVHSSIPSCGVVDRERLPGAEPQGFFAGITKWLASLWRSLFR